MDASTPQSGNPWPPRAATPETLCRSKSPPRRRRNQICIAIIIVGLLNFLAYTLGYAVLGGDAHNGSRRVIEAPDGTRQVVYVVRGHHLRALSGRETRVSGAVWVYSYLHSIAVPLTSGAMIICMLVLARPHILATMRDAWVRGPVFVAALALVVILITVAATALFTAQFIAQLREG